MSKEKKYLYSYDRTEDATRKGKLFIISGPSGAGKGTVCAELLKDMPAKLSVSMTTRAPRKGETNGESYFFVSREEFQKNIDENGFLEYAKVYENFYGTPKAKVLEDLEAGHDVILEIDIQGAMKVKQVFPKGVFIFILPPTMAELRRRITGRGTDTQEVIDMRLSRTLGELSFLEKYDYCVVNGQIQEAVNRVRAIIVAEHSKVAEDIQDLIRRFEEDE